MIPFDLIAAICGATGALILAWSGPRAAWGWPLFLASNIGWIIHALLTQQQPLLWQTVVFTATSLVGIWRGLCRPPQPMWLVGQVTRLDDNPLRNAWEVQGLYTTRRAAEDACLGGNWFVGPLHVGKPSPVEALTWADAYYPHPQKPWTRLTDTTTAATT